MKTTIKKTFLISVYIGYGVILFDMFFTPCGRSMFGDLRGTMILMILLYIIIMKY